MHNPNPIANTEKLEWRLTIVAERALVIKLLPRINSSSQDTSPEEQNMDISQQFTNSSSPKNRGGKNSGSNALSPATQQL
jgi:hypothetical protein